VNADIMLAASFVVAGATVNHVLKVAPPEVTFVITGGDNNDEDISCAEYLEAEFRGLQVDKPSFIQRVYNSKDAIVHHDKMLPEFPLSDLDYCTRINAFDFSMPITKRDNRLTMQALKP
jgi:2-phosphosulfolactate phosphatase